MSDLRTLHRSLASTGVVSTPPVATVAANARRMQVRHLTVFVVGLLVLALVPLSVSRIHETAEAPPVASPSTTTVDGTTGSGTGPGTATPGAVNTTSTTGAPPAAVTGPAPSRFACRPGENGGATGPGVTERRIRLLVSGILDGPEKTMAEDAPQAMRIVFDEVNRSGGICGRIVDVRVVNRLFAYDLSAAEMNDYVAVVPSPFDREFETRLADGSFDRWQILAVGGDGRTRAQFDSRWSRPVGVPTASLTRIAVDEAYRAGARSFALVHDPSTFPQARPAFDDYVRKLPGAQVKAVETLEPSRPSYSTEADRFNAACSDGRCDAVVLALLPETMKTWLQSGPARARVRTGSLSAAADRMAEDCVVLRSEACEEIWWWTGFTPPYADFRDDPDVERYATHFPEPNPFTETAWVTAHVLVQALREAGPDLTRERFREAVDAMTYRSGLVDRLDWSPAMRVGNASARAIRPEVSQATFRRWVDAGTGWVRDPMPGHFPG